MGFYSREDVNEAIKWYKKAANQGYDFAQCALGYIYEKGENVKADKNEAIKWYRKSAENGNSAAQEYLAKIYFDDKNYTEAAKWYTEAGENNNESVYYRLGNLYANGQGVENNEAIANQWFRKAANDGRETAKEKLKNCSATPFVYDWEWVYKIDDQPVELCIQYDTEDLDDTKVTATYLNPKKDKAKCTMTGKVVDGVLILNGGGYELRCTLNGHFLNVEGSKAGYFENSNIDMWVKILEELKERK